MATLDAPKLLVLTNQIKLTLTVTLALTDTVMQKSCIILMKGIFCRGASGVRGRANFFTHLLM